MSFQFLKHHLLSFSYSSSFSPSILSFISFLLSFISFLSSFISVLFLQLHLFFPFLSFISSSSLSASSFCSFISLLFLPQLHLHPPSPSHLFFSSLPRHLHLFPIYALLISLCDKSSFSPLFFLYFPSLSCCFLIFFFPFLHYIFSLDRLRVLPKPPLIPSYQITRR